MWSFISREMRIPVKFDFLGKFELQGKSKFPGNVNLTSRESLNFWENLDFQDVSLNQFMLVIYF